MVPVQLGRSFGRVHACGMACEYKRNDNQTLGRTIYVAACSSRKRFVPSEDLRAANLPSGSQDVVAQEWLQRLGRAPHVSSATDLYCGRSFFEARQVWRWQQVDSYVVSAGLGLVKGSQSIPSYSLTLAKTSPDSIAKKVKGFQPGVWWGAINRRFGDSAPLATLVYQSGGAIIVLALPETYASMVATDLSTLSDSDLSRVRLIGPRDASRVPDRLRRIVMPYDDRFDGADSTSPGTRADFAQRAGRHFVESVLTEMSDGSVEDHAIAVARALETMARPVTAKRQTLTDPEIVALIELHWNAVGGQSSRMLRMLRDVLAVACEQKRFQRLFRAASGGRRLL